MQDLQLITSAENEVVKKLCQDRKSSVFSSLKEWDRNRAMKLMVHRQVCDQIEECLQTKVAQSNDYIIIVKQFFTSILDQQRTYEGVPIRNPQGKFQINLASQQIYIQENASLLKLYHSSVEKSSKRFTQQLEESLSQLDTILTDSHREITEQRTKIELAIICIENINTETERMCDRLITSYNHDKQLKPSQSNSDFYTEVNNFIRQAEEQTRVQTELGTLIAELVDFISKLEMRKLMNIKNLIRIHLQNKEDGDGQHSSLRDILNKDTEKAYIDQLYSASELMTDELTKAVADHLHLHQKEVNLKVVKIFLRKMEPQIFQEIKLLSLKEYRVYANTESEDLLPTRLIITVDAYLNVQADSQNYSYKLQREVKMEPKGDISLQIIPSGGKKKENHFPLIFSNQDQREEFLQFISKIAK